MKKDVIKKVTILVFLILIISLIIYKIVTDNDFKVTLKNNTFYIGGEYENIFKASYRGKDVTDKVYVTHNIFDNLVGTYQIVFTYTTNNKEYSIAKTIKIRDKENPTIKLLYGDKIVLFLKEKYEEPGYKANDAYDGDISHKVKVKGKINTSKVGTYILTYSVKDSSDNKVSIQREVIVTDELPYYREINKYSLEGYFFKNQLYERTSNDINYLDNTVFVGSNELVKYNKYIKKIWNSNDFFKILDMTNEDSTLDYLLKKENPQRVVVLMNYNDIKQISEFQLLEVYKELIEKVKNNSNARMIIQSILPVDHNNMFEINRINYNLLKLCHDENIYFLNTNQSLINESGLLKEDYMYDENIYMEQVIKYFNNHTL